MDLNLDGAINIVDVIAVVNIIIGSINPSDAQLCAADINNDGTVNLSLIHISEPTRPY